MAEEIFIKFETEAFGPNKIFVEIEDGAGNGIDVGTWTEGSFPYVHLGPFMGRVNHPSPMQSEHIDADGEFQSDKYPWCAPGFVPLKLTDPMALGPL